MTATPHDDPGGLITIILPCYNEGATLTASLDTLGRWFASRPVEFLVVDDGSTDDTGVRAEQAAAHDERVRVVRLARNAGKGAAIVAGAPHARGGRILLADADLSYDLPSMEALLAALPSADVVIGNRRHHDSRYTVPVRLFGFLYRRHLVGMAFNALVRMCLPLEARDTQCGLKAFRRDALARIGPALRTPRFAFDVEALMIARGLGLTVRDAPVGVTYESSRTSVQLVRDGLAMGWEVLRVVGRHLRGRYTPGRLAPAARAAGDREPG